MGSAFWSWGRRDCESVEERLDEYLTGALSEGEERTRITAHLSECPECRARVVEYTRVQEAVSSFRAASLPERAGDWQSVRTRLEASSSERGPGARRPVFGGRALATGLVAATLGFVAVAFPIAHELEATPVASMPVNLPVEVNTSRGEAASVSRLMGYVTVGAGKNTLAAAPTFVGTVSGSLVPLVIEVSSDQNAPEAQLEVHPQHSYQDERSYRYTVSLTEGGKSRFLVYPMFDIDKSGGALQFCEVTLTAPGRKQTLRLPLQTNVGSWATIAYVGNRMGAITPRRQYQNNSRQQSHVYPAYVAPENAPDRAIGYEGIRMLVLSPEAATLSASQWRAIREWVTMGGQLVLTSDRLLEIPAIAELAPVQKVVRNAFGTTLVPIKEAIEKDAKLPANLVDQSTTISRRRWGVGYVFFTGFNPATEEFRTWEGCDNFWESMLTAARSQFPESFRMAAHQPYAVEANSANLASDNAFRLTLPPVHFIVFLFLGYFVLVVPMTFAVLKHTRRLNLAWVTGPVLAIVFAGGIFLLTARLYFMPTARRTVGAVFLHSGERAGRFAGSTELFFPKAGRYDLPIPRADLVEMRLSPQDRERPLDSQVNETGETTAKVSVGNLAFRRVHHEQSVDFPGAISVEVQPDAKGELVGFIENSTGKPLLNVSLSKEISVQVNRVNKQPYFVRKTVVHQLGTLPTGRTAVHTDPAKWIAYDKTHYLNYAISAYGTSYVQYDQAIPRFLTLLAQTSGEAFGPKIGQDFSGEQSVTIVVGTNVQKAGGKQ